MSSSTPLSEDNDGNTQEKSDHNNSIGRISQGEIIENCNN
jgi:hypothetical protein